MEGKHAPSSLTASSLFQLVKLAKRLKKEKVNVDIINFGEEVWEREKVRTRVRGAAP